MSKPLLSMLLVATLLVVWVGWNRLQPEGAPTPKQGEAVEQQPADVVAPAEPVANPASTATIMYDTTWEARRGERIDRAQAELDDARGELDRLDAELDAIEGEVERIEAQGLDATEFAEEGMTRLQPVLQAYLDAQLRYDAALKALAAEGVAPTPRPPGRPE